MSGINRTIHRQRNKNTQKSTLRLRHKSDPTKDKKKPSLRKRKRKTKYNRLIYQPTVIPYSPQDDVYLKGSSHDTGSYVHWLRRRMYV